LEFWSSLSSETAISSNTKTWLRLVLTALLFAVLGPPVAGLVAIVLLSSFAMVGSGVPMLEALQVYWLALFPLDPASLYLLPYWGIVPALGAGLFVGWHHGWRGRITVFSSLLLGVGVGALFYLVGAYVGWAGAAFGASFSIAVCVPPMLLLCALARLLAPRAKEAA
jgi:hypothetical protein